MTIALNGTTGFLEHAGRLVSSYPCSMLVWGTRNTNATKQTWISQGQTDAQRKISGLHNSFSDQKQITVTIPGNGTAGTRGTAPHTSATILRPLVVVFNSPTSMAIAFGDGVLQAFADGKTDQLSSHNVCTVGASHFNNSAATEFVDGDMAEAHWYSRALTTADIDALIAGTTKPEDITNWVDGWTLKDYEASGSYLSITGTRTMVAQGGVTASALTHPVARTSTDTDAPVLSLPTATPTGPTTATGTVSTTEANGTLFRITSTNATETGPTLIASGAQTTVTATGVQNITATGLTASTANLRHHFVHRDAAGNVSNVVSSAAFSTPAAGDTDPPTLGAVTAAATAPTVVTGSVSTSEAGGALYRRVSANATESEATMEAGGLFQSVTATGVQNVTAAAPAGTNGLRLHLMHIDASGNKSAVVSSATFNTPAVPVAGVTSTPFKNGTGALQTGLSGLKIAVLPLAMNAVTKPTTGTTHATTAVNVVSDSALVAGTKYVHVALSADDTIVSAEILTAA